MRLSKTDVGSLVGIALVLTAVILIRAYCFPLPWGV